MTTNHKCDKPHLRPLQRVGSRWVRPVPTAENPFPKVRRVRRRGRKAKAPEASLQAACEDYLELVGLPYLHIPDAAYRICSWDSGASIGAKRQLADHCAGFPDLAIFLQSDLAQQGIPPLCHPCLLIELKSSVGKQNAAQKRWARQLTVHVCRDFDTFKGLVDQFRGAA